MPPTADGEYTIGLVSRGMSVAMTSRTPKLNATALLQYIRDTIDQGPEFGVTILHVRTYELQEVHDILHAEGYAQEVDLCYNGSEGYSIKVSRPDRSSGADLSLKSILVGCARRSLLSKDGITYSLSFFGYIPRRPSSLFGTDKQKLQQWKDERDAFFLELEDEGLLTKQGEDNYALGRVFESV